MKKTCAFSGKRQFLSNMYVCDINLDKPIQASLDDNLSPDWMLQRTSTEPRVFKSSEHLYQACKSNEAAWADLVLDTQSPEKTKTLARKLIPSVHPLFEAFESVDRKISIMEWIVREKFLQNNDLMKMLKNTGGEELVETNFWNDSFWGVCDDVGENHLGKILMRVREL